MVDHSAALAAADTSAADGAAGESADWLDALVAGGLAVAGAAWLVPKLVRWTLGQD